MTGCEVPIRQARPSVFAVLASLGLLALAGCQDQKITGPAQRFEPQVYNSTIGYWEVNTTADHVVGSCDALDGAGADCTLREAVAAASPGDEIRFAESVTGTITLCSTCFEISFYKDLTIVGPGPDVLAVSGGDQTFQVFSLSSPYGGPASSITIRGLTIRNGGRGGVTISNGAWVLLEDVVITENRTAENDAAGISIWGWSHLTLRNSAVVSNTATTGYGNGGIMNSYSYVTIESSTISDNRSQAYGVGGIKNNGDMTVENSTVSGNAGYLGGGIANASSTLRVRHSTISGNSATAFGYAGGLDLYQGIVSLANSVISGNSSPKCPDVSGGSSASSFTARYNLIGATEEYCHPIADGVDGNLVGVSANLGPLADNGGPTLTHALLSGSPAINAGDPLFDAASILYDQRGDGYARVVNDRIDMGAFEAQYAPTPDELLEDLIDQAAATDGVSRGTVNKLYDALKHMEAGRTRPAVNALKEFIEDIQSHSGKKIAEEDADALITAAQEIIDALQASA